MNSSPLLGHRNASRRTRSIFSSVELPCGRYGGPNVAPSVLRWTENHSPVAAAVPSGCSIGAVAVHEIGHRSTSAPVRPLLPQFIGAVAVRLYNHSLCTAQQDGRQTADKYAGMDTMGARSMRKDADAIAAPKRIRRYPAGAIRLSRCKWAMAVSWSHCRRPRYSTSRKRSENRPTCWRIQLQHSGWSSRRRPTRLPWGWMRRTDQGSNSIEQMLAHQTAAADVAGRSRHA